MCEHNANWGRYHIPISLRVQNPQGNPGISVFQGMRPKEASSYLRHQIHTDTSECCPASAGVSITDAFSCRTQTGPQKRTNRSQLYLELSWKQSECAATHLQGDTG